MLYVVFTGTALSLIGTSVIILFYTCIPKVREKAGFTLIFQISIADLLFSTIMATNIYLISRNMDEACSLLAYLAEVAYLAIEIWSLLFSYSIYQFSRGRYTSFDDVKKVLPAFMMIGWGLPLLFGLMPLFMGVYGKSIHYCWITANKDYS